MLGPPRDGNLKRSVLPLSLPECPTSGRTCRVALNTAEGAHGRQANTSGALVNFFFHCRKQVFERKNSEEEKLLGIIALKVPVC